MAEIQVERKPRSHAGLILGLLLLVAVLGAGWYFTMGPGAGTMDADGPDVVEEAPASSPSAPPPPPPSSPAPQGQPGAAPTPQQP